MGLGLVAFSKDRPRRMMVRIHSASLRLVVAVALALGMFASFVHTTVAHSPLLVVVGVADHVAESGEPRGDHDHSHEDADAALLEHSHGHNLLDHAHDTVSPLPALHLLFGPQSLAWPLTSPVAAHLGGTHRLDRPPRQTAPPA